MRALFVCSEIHPLAKTGGLADVAHALPPALRALGADVRLLMPGYPCALDRVERAGPAIPLGAVLGHETALVPGRVPGTGAPVWLVRCPALFERPGGLYADEAGEPWPDNDLRFALLCHVAARIALGLAPLGWRPDLVHAHDWHAGLVPLLLRQWAGETAPPCLFTIHNMAFHGLFDFAVAERIGIPRSLLTVDGAEFHGRISFLKAGLRFADHISTVSPTYAREIMTERYGAGLHGLLRHRAADLSGILNGADYANWDPRHDPALDARYGPRDLSGKAVCKATLQAELGLAIDPEVPLFGYMSRLTEQKMADHVLAIAPAIAERFGQLVVVAEGERRFEGGFAEVARRYPDRIAAVIGYTEHAAHRLLGAADMLLAPARFEPCGLTHLYAMRYGALPVARLTGGLADTIVDATHQTLAAGTANGFHLERAESEELTAAILRATILYHQPLVRRRMRKAAMAQDFSWGRAAEQYRLLYRMLGGINVEPELAEADERATA